jgi:uncharacterized membrane protein YsdA (DUF1294 family)
MDLPAALYRAIGPANLVTGLIALNFIAFAAFGIDKALAEAGRRRVAEATLLLWAALGGTPGAYAGRALFRHKTRKQPFCGRLHRIAVLQALAVAGLAGWRLAG